MKKLFVIFTLFILSISPAYAQKKVNPKVQSMEFYTQFNIWHEDSNIPSTNYHLGDIIPAGTKVKIDKVDPELEYIEFHVDGSKKKLFIMVRKAVTKLPLDKVFYRYFSDTDPLADGGKFSKFTSQEQNCIKKGIIEKGMSKDAVIMAYGYPPAHKTPTLDADFWRYWKNNYSTQTVTFEDGVVTDMNMGNVAED